MPTFTGETGARIRDLEARLAAVETAPGGGANPSGDGLFSAFPNTLIWAQPNVVTFLRMDTEQYDLSNWFDTVTGRFRPQLAGYYRLTASVFVQSQMSTDLTYLALLMFKNGSLDKSLHQLNTQGPLGDNLLSGSLIVKANGTTDYFQPGVRQNSAVEKQTGYGSTGGNHFQGELIAPS